MPDAMDDLGRCPRCAEIVPLVDGDEGQRVCSYCEWPCRTLNEAADAAQDERDKE